MGSCDMYNGNLTNYGGFNQHIIREQEWLKAEFVLQPPDDLRKSNFFKFMITFSGPNNEVVDIESAKFVTYINESHEMDFRNGLKYIVCFRYPNGGRQLKDVFLILVDSTTLEPIRYEGSDDSPKMMRVLLTHESICSRCSQQRSCGNKNEAPSDPLIIERKTLKFFLKCNQNCLKGAGNPKDMRRFSVSMVRDPMKHYEIFREVKGRATKSNSWSNWLTGILGGFLGMECNIAMSFTDITHDKSGIIVLSTKIFVHNNSKHSRKRRKAPSFDPCSLAPIRIFETFPSSGTYGTSLALFGENFFHEMQVSIGPCQAETKVMSERLITVTVPCLTSSGIHPIILGHGDQYIKAGFFQYEMPFPSEVPLVHPKVGIRGEELMLFGRTVSVSGAIIFCHGTPLSTNVLNGCGLTTIIPRETPVGQIEVTVKIGNKLFITFNYYIQDRSLPEFKPTYGFLILYNRDQVQNSIPIDQRYNELRAAGFHANIYDHPSPTSSSGNSNGSDTSLYCTNPQYPEDWREKMREGFNRITELHQLFVPELRPMNRAAVEETTALSNKNRQIIKNASCPSYFM